MDLLFAFSRSNIIESGDIDNDFAKSFISAVYLVLFKGDQLLLQKRSNTGYEDGNYGLVSGHVEGNETLRKAILREANEEIGLSLSADNTDLGLVMHRFAETSTPSERLDFFMHISDWQGEPANMEPTKCSELCWANPQNLPGNVIPYIRQAIVQMMAGNRYCEYGWTYS